MPHAYGWRPDRPDHRDLVLHESLAVPILPSRVDLRETGCLGFPIYDQEQLGSCTANALAAAVRFQEAKQHSRRPVAPSRLFIYYEERRREGSVGTDAGAEIRDGMKVIAKTGCPDETFWPYDIARFADMPPEVAYREAGREHVTRYFRVPVLGLAMKGALALGYPIVCGFSVFAGIQSDEALSTGRIPMPDPDEAPEGGHAVLTVGYDDEKRLWTIRNSWGDVGDHGYFYVPYSYLDSPAYSGDFWVVRRERQS